MLPIWRDNWLFLLLDEKNSRERDVPERVLVEPFLYYNINIFLCQHLIDNFILASMRRNEEVPINLRICLHVPSRFSVFPFSFACF